jgi:hypothetical protein
MRDAFFEARDLHRSRLAGAPIAQHHVPWSRSGGEGPCLRRSRTDNCTYCASHLEVRGTDASALRQNPGLITGQLLL